MNASKNGHTAIVEALLKHNTSVVAQESLVRTIRLMIRYDRYELSIV
jgi:hypothetical protein